MLFGSNCCEHFTLPGPGAKRPSVPRPEIPSKVCDDTHTGLEYSVVPYGTFRDHLRVRSRTQSTQTLNGRLVRPHDPVLYHVLLIFIIIRTTHDSDYLVPVNQSIVLSHIRTKVEMCVKDQTQLQIVFLLHTRKEV